LYLNFYDFITDGKIDDAMKFFENPFDTNLNKSKIDLKSVAAMLGTKEKVDNKAKEEGSMIRNDIKAAVNAAFALQTPNIKGKTIELLMIQAYFLSGTNDAGRNSIHLACFKGFFTLIDFLVKKADSDYLNILPMIINAKDEMSCPPLYYLCRRGYDKKFDKDEQREKQYRKRAIQVLIPKDFVNDPKAAEWAFVAPQIKFTAMHWLAFWNDTDSIQYLLEVIP